MIITSNAAELQRKISVKFTIAKNAVQAKQGAIISPAVGFTSLQIRKHPTKAQNVAKHTASPTQLAPDPRTIGSQTKLKPSWAK